MNRPATDVPALRPHRLLPAVVLAALLAAGGLGCGDSPDAGRFEIGEIRAHDKCLQAASPLKPTFFAARERRDSVGLFMQTKARVESDADVVWIEVLKPAQAKRNPDKVYSFEYPPAEKTPVRAELLVEETCPDLNVSLAIRGRARFDKLNLEAGEKVVGELLEGAVVDARTGEVVAGSISGRWNFDVEITAPHRDYPTYGDDYPRNP